MKIEWRLGAYEMITLMGSPVFGLGAESMLQLHRIATKYMYLIVLQEAESDIYANI